MDVQIPPAKDIIAKSEPAHVVHSGVDLGRKKDHTAVAIMEVRRLTDGSNQSVALIRQLERYPLDLQWPDIWRRVARTHERTLEIMRGDWQAAYDRASLESMDARYIDPDDSPTVTPPPTPTIKMRYDATGVGDAQGDQIFYEVHPSYRGQVVPYECYFNHGDRLVGPDHRRYSVGKAWLVSYLQAMIGSERLKISPEIYHVEEMVQELMDFQVQVTDRMNERYGAFSVGAHDDLLTAMGLAAMDIKPPRKALSGFYSPSELGF